MSLAMYLSNTTELKVFHQILKYF